ncbi:hypothetical protein Tco_0413739 [Tanacetum coccineum]
MASEQHGLGPELQRLTSRHISSGFVLNQDVSTSAKPPTKNDWDALFQPMFDEYFKPSSVVSTSISAATLLPSDTPEASFSTSINKDAPTPIKEEPTNYKEAMIQSSWVEAMQEDIHEFERPEVLELIPRPEKVMIINLKWIFKVKLDEYGGVLKNKA